jgi:cell division protein FtsA
MEEIIEHVYYEIKSSGYEKKLIAGIIITGGGSQLKHLPQLVEYVTGLDCRVGYPNEHLAKNEVLPKATYDLLKSPMYATSIGLLIDGVQSADETPEVKVATKEPKVGVMEEIKSDDGGLFAKLFRKTKEFIEDEVVKGSIDDKDYL